MLFDGFSTYAFFGNKFHGGAEEVMVESPFIAVEPIKKVDDLGII